MTTEISFQLFGKGGFINPTPWSFAIQDPSLGSARYAIPFYDFETRQFLQKQTRDFDGGWRWFDAYDIDALTIYNIKLDRRAYAHITHLEIENALVSPELVLLCAKSCVIVEHSYYTCREYVLDYIRALANRTRIKILEEIRGESKSRLHSV